MGARFLEVSGDLLLYLMLFGMLVTMYFGALKRKRNVVICNIPMLPCAIGSVVSFIEVSHKPYRSHLGLHFYAVLCPALARHRRVRQNGTQTIMGRMAT